MRRETMEDAKFPEREVYAEYRKSQKYRRKYYLRLWSILLIWLVGILVMLKWLPCQIKVKGYIALVLVVMWIIIWVWGEIRYIQLDPNPDHAWYSDDGV